VVQPMYEYRKITPEERREILRERKSRGYPLHAPPHFKNVAGVYLITAACYEHRHIFNTPDLLSLLMDEILASFTKAELEYKGWVFLTNHYHIIIETPDISCIGEVLRKAHSRTATKVNYKQDKKGRKVWHLYSDRLMRNEQHNMATLNYIHYNPIKHGYVERMTDWPWSSVHSYRDTMEEEELRQVWKRYPIGNYGKGWDWR